MSARQRARLRKWNQNNNVWPAEDSDDSEELDNVKLTRFQFDSDDDSNDDENLDDYDEGNKDAHGNLSAPVIPAKKKDKRDTSKESDYFEEALKDSSTLKNAATASEENESAQQPNGLFSVDTSSLDIEVLLRKRFGVVAGKNAKSKNLRRHEKDNKRLLRQKLIFGSKKDEWVRPPPRMLGLTRVEGRVGFDITNARTIYFSFVVNEEFQRMQLEYHLVQQSGDANRLVKFLSRHPYHAEGFLQLAMIFARLGHMDRASDLVSRSLYCLETACSSLSAFRWADICCRMDPANEQNATLFSSLFRHMQLCGMRGCPGIAADVALLLLALCPEGDPKFVLLVLDFFLVSAGRLGRLLDFLGYVDKKDDALLDELFEGKNSSPNAFVLGVLPISSANQPIEQRQLGAAVANNDGGDVYSVRDLPNWSFSVALALFNEAARFRRGAGESGGGSVDNYAKGADAALRMALLRWPFMLVPLVKAARIEGKAIAWRSVLSNPFFADAHQRVPKASPLLHISAVYANRNATLWARDDVQAWLRVSAQYLSDTMLTSTYYDELHFDRLSAAPQLRKYAGALLEDFGEDFPRLPPEANPLDPRLAEPDALLAPIPDPFMADEVLAATAGRTEGAKLDGLAAMELHLERFLDEDGEVDEEAVINEVRKLRRAGMRVTVDEVLQQIEQIDLAERQHSQPLGQRPQLGVATTFLEVDLSAPLHQLFWQTMLPWYTISTRNR